MCGICGRLELDSARPPSMALVRTMTRILAHRGPDDETIWTEGPLALGHRRLSIIDLDGGRQPVANETGTVHVILNGEIYNFRELGRELTAKGHRFRTRSDTEVIVHAYEEWGTEAVERLRGMFAFALWDTTRRRLLLARDRLGIKPLLYIYKPGRYLAFASEIKALLADHAFAVEMDPLAIDQYLALQYVPAPASGIRGISKLPPAHALVVDLHHEVRCWEYWDPAGVEPVTDRRAARRGLLQVVTEAVESHLVSDVPVGSFLSGGLDSGIVTALMARAQADPVRAITVGFGDTQFDERESARLVAEQYGCLHRTPTLDADALNTFDRVLEYVDEPFADWSTLPTYLVSGAAREEVKVVLSGDGGDELFGGYARHRAQRIEGGVRSITDRLGSSVRRAVVGAYPGFLPGRGSVINLQYDRALALARKHAHGFFVEDAERHALYGPALRDHLPPLGELAQGFAEPFRRYADRMGHRDWLSAALYVELKTYLVDDILTKVDRMSMAHSLEVRVPYLDHRVVEFALSIPSTWKVGWREGKLLMRETFRELLPARLWRQPKRGFDIPADAWLRTSLRERAEDLLLGDRARQRGVLDPVKVEGLWAAQRNGTRRLARKTWALMMLEAWFRVLDRRQVT